MQRQQPRLAATGDGSLDGPRAPADERNRPQSAQILASEMDRSLRLTSRCDSTRNRMVDLMTRMYHLADRECIDIDTCIREARARAAWTTLDPLGVLDSETLDPGHPVELLGELFRDVGMDVADDELVDLQHVLVESGPSHLNAAQEQLLSEWHLRYQHFDGPGYDSSHSSAQA